VSLAFRTIVACRQHTAYTSCGGTARPCMFQTKLLGNLILRYSVTSDSHQQLQFNNKTNRSPSGMVISWQHIHSEP